MTYHSPYRITQSSPKSGRLHNTAEWSSGDTAVKWQKKLNVNKHRIPHLRKISPTINPRWWLITSCHSQKTFWSSWAGLSKNANVLHSNSQKLLSNISARKHWRAKQKIIHHLCSKSKGEMACKLRRELFFPVFPYSSQYELSITKTLWGCKLKSNKQTVPLYNPSLDCDFIAMGGLSGKYKWADFPSCYWKVQTHIQS